MRLILTRPQPDETISSILDRACSLYSISRSMLLSELCPGNYDWPSGIDLDVNPPPRLIESLARALDLPPQALERLRLDKVSWRLLPKARLAYCPKCLNADCGSGRDPYFRADWSWCFMTHCAVHRCPLLMWTYSSRQIDHRRFWRCQLAGGENFAPLVDWDDFTVPFPEFNRIDWSNPEIGRVWAAIVTQEQELLAWITAGDARKAAIFRLRMLYVLATGKWTKPSRGPLMNKLVPVGAAERLFDLGQWSLPAGRGVADSWKRIRSAWLPGYRRAASWVVSQIRHPGPPVALQGFPLAATASSPQWFRRIVWARLLEEGRGHFREALGQRDNLLLGTVPDALRRDKCVLRSNSATHYAPKAPRLRG